MIISGLLNLIFNILKLMFALIPSLPIISFLTNILTFFNNTICKGIPLLCFFIRPTTLSIAIPIAVALFLFRYTYFLIIWIAKKIPFIGVE